MNKKISRRMVEARRRRRLTWTEGADSSGGGRVPRPRRRPAKWTLAIRDGEHGSRLVLHLYCSPWPNVWLVDGQLLSSAALARRLRALITHAA